MPLATKGLKGFPTLNMSCHPGGHDCILGGGPYPQGIFTVGSYGRSGGQVTAAPLEARWESNDSSVVLQKVKHQASAWFG